MQHSNPVVSAVVDGVALDLVLTTDVDGVWVCLDLNASESESKSAPAMGMDFDHARKLLRSQLPTLQRYPTTREVRIPAWNRSQSASVAYFGLQEQLATARAVEFFLLGANASGFLGVGLAARPQASLLWSLLQTDWYSYEGMAGAGNHSAVMRVEAAAAAEGSRAKRWSEPAGPSVMVTSANNQGISFPIHGLHFRCRKQGARGSEASATDASSEHEEERAGDGEVQGGEGSSSAAGGAAYRTVDAFGSVTGNWDAVVDLNAPCLVLPVEFYSALAGWVGMTYNGHLGVSELPPSSPTRPPSLPVLYFSLSYGARPVALPLASLLLPELQLNASGASGASSASTARQVTRRLCVQRSTSIVQNGATVFATLSSDAATVQRYRMQGSLSLPLFNMLQAPVVLGAMAVQAAGGLSVRGANRSSAMTVRSADGLATDDLVAATCAPEQSACVGEQQYSESTNTCADPDCSRYYFHSLDEEAKRCVMDSVWLTALAVTLATFAATELFFSSSIRRLVHGAALEATTS